ncbi:putative phosphoglycerate mutase family protein [Daldinia childiae]|uniref:putative phosphoglycerate mutase family protein n=1 Tax=Daldinia childiae TaxID=326645 RepID=UPI0014485E6A|nr:putative phosphoglycerate mutase family protein [Daldinia childiae]KAF3071087.1 putative phosphoglycerate mutase family protein [Daldinia childiae]
MAPTIDIIRHAQASHNIHGGHIRDAILTDDGVVECHLLRETFPFGSKVTNIVSSPLRRAIDTAILGVLPLVDNHIKVKLLPDLQEISPAPSSTGIPKSVLSSQYSGVHNLDMDDLDEYWYRKGFNTPYAPVVDRVEARARSARQYLRMLARTAIEAGKDDAHIVVVTHGEFAHWLTGDFRGVSETRNSGWRNTECRSYQIRDIFGSGHSDPELVETGESIERRNGPLFYFVMNAFTIFSPRNIATRRVIDYGEIFRAQERLSLHQANEEPEQLDDEPDISDDGWIDMDESN